MNVIQGLRHIKINVSPVPMSTATYNPNCSNTADDVSNDDTSQSKQSERNEMKTVFTPEKLRKLILKRKNVLIIGPTGVGKTSIVKKALEGIEDYLKENDKDYNEVFTKDIQGVNSQDLMVGFKWFTGSTIDEHIDTRGIPIAKTANVFGKEVDVMGFASPDFVRSAEKMRVLVIDELNRATQAAMASFMSIIDEKQINGTPLPGLRSVIAMINPFDDNGDYIVNQLDHAVRERFPVILELKNDFPIDYFQSQYGDEVTEAITNWYTSLENDVKMEISPRRIEFALKQYMEKDQDLPVSDVLFKDEYRPAFFSSELTSLMVKYENLSCSERKEMYLNDPESYMKISLKGREYDQTYINEMRDWNDEIFMRFFSKHCNIITANFKSKLSNRAVLLSPIRVFNFPYDHNKYIKLGISNIVPDETLSSIDLVRIFPDIKDILIKGNVFENDGQYEMFNAAPVA